MAFGRSICGSWENFWFFAELDEHGGPISPVDSPRARQRQENPDFCEMQGKLSKKRLDLVLVDRALVESRQKAQAVILAGNVRVGGQRADKAGALVPMDAAIEVIGETLRYASRGGLKLAGALAEFGVDATGKICLDAGCSTGGFTDCLLQHGAARVYAVDVTVNQLAWKLQRDPRVRAIECNVRYLQPGALGEPPSLVTVDLSFISAAKVLPRLVAAAAAGAEFLILVKPQFELARGDVGKGGIVRDPALHERAIERVRAAATAAGLRIVGARPSQVMGAEGNQEFFLYALLPDTPNLASPPKSLR
jgi:23S rRNA (cytidine1920-2'-O)/16S rRNA (cytidine1409-2'-O)-methyltransferase